MSGFFCWYPNCWCLYDYLGCVKSPNLMMESDGICARLDDVFEKNGWSNPNAGSDPSAKKAVDSIFFPRVIHMVMAWSSKNHRFVDVESPSQKVSSLLFWHVLTTSFHLSEQTLNSLNFGHFFDIACKPDIIQGFQGMSWWSSAELLKHPIVPNDYIHHLNQD